MPADGQLWTKQWLSWRPFPGRRDGQGFTLADLLVSLALLGTIATFTIPKVLVASQQQKENAIIKETAATIAASYQLYKINNRVTIALRGSDLYAYMNYINQDMTTPYDAGYGVVGNYACGGDGVPCIRLHNGALLWSYDYASFGSLGANNAMIFNLDPDGVLTSAGAAYGPGKTIELFLYYNGRVSTRREIDNPTCSFDGCRTPIASSIPASFQW